MYTLNVYNHYGRHIAIIPNLSPTQVNKWQDIALNLGFTFEPQQTGCIDPRTMRYANDNQDLYISDKPKGAA